MTKSAKYSPVSHLLECQLSTLAAFYTFLSFAVFLFYVSKFMLIEKNDDKHVYHLLHFLHFGISEKLYSSA